MAWYYTVMTGAQSPPVTIYTVTIFTRDFASRRFSIIVSYNMMTEANIKFSINSFDSLGSIYEKSIVTFLVRYPYEPRYYDAKFALADLADFCT